MENEKVFTLANMLSFSRIILGLAFLSLFIVIKISNLTPTFTLVLQVVSITVFIIAIITDGLDGWVARRNNQVTNLGKHLDPLADSIFFIIVFSTFTVIGLMPWYFLAAIVLREGFMHLYLRPWFSRNKASLPANIHGKIKMFMQCTFSLIIICGLMLREITTLASATESILNTIDTIVGICAYIFFAIIVFLSLFSLTTYLVHYFQFRKRES